MKHFLIIFLFLGLFLIKPIDSIAVTTPPTQNTNKCVVSDNGSSAPALTVDDEAEDLESIGMWTGLWNWLWGKFKKTDYIIGQQRPLSDMNTFGVAKTKGYKKKHSFIGSRITNDRSQDCLKGKVIRKVILELDSYSDHTLSKICLNDGNGNFSNCKDKTIKDLAHYFVQLSKNFYCDKNSNFINIEQNVKDAVRNDPNLKDIIPDYELDCYQQIYNSFYLSPEDKTNSKSGSEENIKTMIQSPLSAKDQDSTKSNKEINEQLNQNFSPEGCTDCGLYGLRPYKEQ